MAVQRSWALVHISAFHVSMSRHFWYACPRSSTRHTGTLRGVASALIAGALRGITCHRARGCVGGARYSGLPRSVLIVWSAIATFNRCASHSWIMHPAINAIVLVMLVSCGKTARSAQGIELRVTVFPVLARPETFLAGTGSIVVGWRRTVALLTLVGAGKKNLEGSRNDEKEAGANSLVGVLEWHAGASERTTHAAIMATMNAARCNWQD